MATKAKSKKRKNQTDSTLRNIRSANKRLARLEQWCAAMTEDLNNLNDAMLEVHPNFYVAQGLKTRRRP